MTAPSIDIAPVILDEAVGIGAAGDLRAAVTANGREIGRIDVDGRGMRRFILDLAGALPKGEVVELAVGAVSARFRAGGWSGAVRRLRAGVVDGAARDEIMRSGAKRVVALSGGRVLAEATPAADGAFSLTLPKDLLDGPPTRVLIAIAGSDFVLEGGVLTLGRSRLPAAPVRPRTAVRPRRIAIRTATPDAGVAHEWGDHHFALSLKRALDDLGWHAEVMMRDSDPAEAEAADVALTLRGRQDYAPIRKGANLLWLISHPDRMPVSECEDHDHVFVASEPYAKDLAARVSAPVSVLHQATDPAVFREPDDRADGRTCLFVGNSRREWRRMVAWCVERDLPLALWGGGWEGLVPPSMLRGAHVPNDRLHQLYADAAVVLNDHWDTMRDEGFLSNRLFDASAAGAPIVTDPVRGLADVFGDSILTAADGAELARHVAAILKDPNAARARARTAQRIVMERHTFARRAEAIVETAERLLSA